jgi:hypothetical protein
MKKKHYSMKLKQMSDIPQGILQNPANHPVDNLAARGGIPLGQSGAQMMSPTDSAMPGGGQTSGA